MSSNQVAADLVLAIHFSANKHKDQRRKNKDKTPYINHPIEVCAILTECGVTDVSTLQAAVLHDTIEDTKTSYDELQALFGYKVAAIVQECSDDKSLGKVQRKQLQIEHASSVSDEAKLVKLADKYSNLNSIFTDPPSEWSDSQRTGYFIWSYLIVEQQKGINEKLDKKLEDLFKRAGTSLLTHKELDDGLEEYYTLIQDQK